MTLPKWGMIFCVLVRRSNGKFEKHVIFTDGSLEPEPDGVVKLEIGDSIESCRPISVTGDMRDVAV
jgi:hypothetical protein